MSIAEVIMQEDGTLRNLHVEKEVFSQPSYKVQQLPKIENICVSSSTFIPLIPLNIPQVIKEREMFVKSGKHVEAMKKVEEELFSHYKGIAQVFDLTLEDATELPKIVDDLKEKGLIDESSWFKLLDMLLVLDGLMLQVTQEEPLSEKDFKLLLEISEELAKINIPGILQTIRYVSYQETWMTMLSSQVTWNITVSDSTFTGTTYCETLFTSSSTLAHPSIMSFK